ncbi:MAG: DUF2087 domain-containing protein [Rhodobacteraceae bacterium]|nr:DUF2087 domain-containing protein [Paracoccaceae bacterium]MBR9820461.1 DUF2087 domain-containing protein [Paracoccaceae bacterium]
MPRQLIPLTHPDVSTFARSLSRQLAAGGEAPSHLALMNMLARAAGYRNFQQMRASSAAGTRLERVAAAPADLRAVERALHQFDATGRLRHWPAKRQVRALCLAALWARLPAGTLMREAEVNALLNAAHLFADPAQLRRELVSEGLVRRNRDGSDYRRVEVAPSAEARALIGQLAKRRKEAADA